MGIKKDVLIKKIEGFIEEEDKIVVDLGKNIQTAIEFTDCKEESKKRIIEILQTLQKESTEHAKIQEDMIEKIKGEDKDVY
jgi:tryptophanyl-tRNA synthetase